MATASRPRHGSSLKADYAVVWDGIVGPWFLEQVASRLGACKIPLQYLVLRPGRTTAMGRVRGRDDVVDTTGAEVMYAQFADLGDLELHVVSSDGPPAQVLEECRAALADRRLKLGADRARPRNS